MSKKTFHQYPDEIVKLANTATVECYDGAFIYRHENVKGHFSEPRRLDVYVDDNLVSIASHACNLDRLVQLFTIGEINEVRWKLAEALLDVREDGMPVYTDTGFIVFGDWSYEQFFRAATAALRYDRSDAANDGALIINTGTSTKAPHATHYLSGDAGVNAAFGGNRHQLVNAALEHFRPYGAQLVETDNQQGEERTIFEAQPYRIHMQIGPSLSPRESAAVVPILRQLRTEAGLKRSQFPLPDVVVVT